ncbi:tetratricopeptide repeat protein [Spirochaeta cellobiosiphila]|uniref:tetratricopeptide repeat protein n=1 Tax=Spirochaeta cellobiosiphila TaxID=504483 RepID=UPI000568782F|nr:hypothetical protein [Spirochaeta cellobiosiphila]
MKNLALVLMLILTTSVFGEFWNDVPEMLRPDLADAYYQAGEQYAKSNQAEKAKQYKAMALKIYPEYKPGQEVPKMSVPQTDKEAESIPSSENIKEEVVTRVRQQNLQVERLVHYQFTKAVRALVTENTGMLLSVLDSQLYVGNMDNKIDRNQLEIQLPKMFESRDFTSIPPNALYDLSSITIGHREDGTYALTVSTNSTYDNQMAQIFTFWNSEQTFIFTPSGKTWLISGIE